MPPSEPFTCTVKVVPAGSDVTSAASFDVVGSAKDATRTIPIVMAVSNDPVQTQMVSSLARPGGNITGVTLIASDLAAKRLQFLKEIAPAMTRVGILWNPDHVDPEYRETQVTARQLGLQLHSLEVRHPADLDGAFGAAATARLEAMVIVSSRLTAIARAQIQEAATKHQIVLVCGWGPWAQHGALLAYGPDVNATVRLAAAQVDKILKGAKPGELPIEQPTRFQLVINTKTAKAFGLTVPSSLLLRAVQVIECGSTASRFCDRCLDCGISPRGRVADLTITSFVELGGELHKGCFNATISIGG